MRNLIVAVAMMAGCTLLADTETVDGVTWTYVVSDGQASVGDGMGSWDNGATAVPTNTAGAVTIPSTLGGCPVTGISDYAFTYCLGLTTVTIPSSVTNIASSAFSWCSGLTAFVVDAANPRYRSGNGLLLTKDGLTVLVGICGDVVIPASVTSVGDSAFAGCSGMTTVTIPPSVTNIGNYAFFGCGGLTAIEIPFSVKSIGCSAFVFCTGLTNVVFHGDAPIFQSGIIWAAEGCTATVYDGTTGWDDDGDGMWEGLKLVYRSMKAIPDLGENPTREQIEEALAELADKQLAVCITNGTNYAAFRTWASAVSGGPQAVMAAPNAWLSFALDSKTLISKLPGQDDVKVRGFEPAAGGAFAFTVGIEGIEVGTGAAKENLMRVFGLRGGTSPDKMSSDVDIEFSTPVDGRARFTAKPDGDLPAYFMRVGMSL